jgi:Protein of unknown function (DUF3433)
MRRGPSSAEKSLLLDYSSPLLVVAFLRACRNRHFPVSLTITGFVLIKILTVLSTGLLVLQDFPILGSHTQLIVTTMFDSRAFSQGDLVDSRPVYAVFGTQDNGMPFPKGTTKYNAFQSFEAGPGSQVPPSSELVGSVDVFGADLKCETAELTFANAESEWSRATIFVEYQNISVISSSCQVYSESLNVTDDYGPVTRVGSRGLVEVVDCTNTPAADVAKRLLIAVIFLKEDENTQRMINSTALLCTPSYNIMHAQVAINSSMAVSQDIHFLSSDESKPRTLTGLSNWDLTLGVMKSASLAQSLHDPDTEPTSLGKFLGMAFSQSKGDIPNFMDSRVLIEQSRNLFRLITTQIAAQYLMIPIRKEIEGTYNHSGSLLVPRSGPLRAMQGVLAALIVVNLILLFTAPRNALPRSAESIGGMATIFARSADALEPLRGLGHVSSKTLRVIIQPALYHTSVSQPSEGSTFRIERTGTSRGEKPHSQTRREPVSFSPGTWWLPAAFRLPMMIATLTSPLVIVVVLEATLRISTMSDGFSDVDPSSNDRLVWIFLPTIVLVLVATLFNLLDFEIATVQPYQVLMRGNTAAIKTITQMPLRRTAVFALYNRILAGYVPVIATAVAVIVAPLLTIIVSGLIFFQKVPYSGSIGLTQETWFNTTPNPEYLPFDAANALNLIVQANMTYPKWTYDELVFPNVSVSSLADNSTDSYFDQAQYMNMVMPALRGRFNCTPWPITNLYHSKVNTESNPTGSDIGTLNDTDVGRVVVNGSRLLLTLPDSLVGNIALADKPMNHYEFTFANVTSPDGSGYSAFEALTQGLLFYGHFTGNILDNFTITSCSPYVESVNAQVTLSLPHYVFSDAQPPRVLEETASFFAPVPPIGNPDFGTLTTTFQSLNTTDGNAFSPFFQALVYGKDGVPAEELMNQSRLIEASEHLYRVYKAQTMNAYYRTPSPQNTKPLKGTFLFDQRIRLQQSEVSTRLLQGLLVLLLLCGIVAYAILWIDTKGRRRVIPRNPHSIASVACLLAGSEMVSERKIPPGAEWWSDTETKKNGLFETGKFSLGWWEGGGKEGGSRFGIDVGNISDEEDSEPSREFVKVYDI